MSSRWFKKIKSKVRHPDSASPRVSPPSVPIAQPSAVPQTSAAPQTSTSTTSLKERLWNQAYDELKLSESDVVEAYEKLLSDELLGDNPPPTATAADGHSNKPPSEERWRLMERLVQAGLQKIEKEAATKQKISEGIRIISPLKDVIGKAMQAAPQAAVAWVGVSFALELLANPFTEPGINLDGIAYVTSRMEWYWNLVDLLLDQEGSKPEFEGLRGQLEKHILELYQELLVYQIKSICLYNRKRVVVFLRDIVKLENWTIQIDDIKAAETAVLSDSEQYNSQKTRRHLQLLETTAEHQLKEMQSVTNAIHQQTKRQEEYQQSQDDKKCLNDLFQTDPRHDKTRIQETKGGLLRESYCWILDHPKYREWRTDAQRRLLWIRGDPGKGKTMLLCGIIDELEKDSSSKLAYFFCQATVGNLSNATSVLRGLIFSLAKQYPRLIRHVREEYDGGGKQRFEDLNAWEVMSKILKAMLHDPILDDVLLIVDALDECETNRPKLLHFITQVSLTSRAKWIVSSRNWLEIEEILGNGSQQITPKHQDTLSLELNPESVSEAVRSYIQYKVDELAVLKSYDNTTRAEVQRHLINNSNDTFLWVALVCKHLAGENVRKRHTREALKRFPPGLESLYERMIDYISRSDDADICKDILAVFSVVYRPLTLQELMCMVQLPASFGNDLQILEELIVSCGSFLTLRGDTIYFVHQSAKDFLLNKTYKGFDQILPFGIAQQHYNVFSRSLEVLSKILKRDIYELRAPGSLTEDIIPPDPDPLAPLKYSCTYWVDHLQHSNPTDSPARDDLRDNASIHKFMGCHYLHWLEAQSLLLGMSEAVLAIGLLENLVTSADSQQLTDLIRDAHRFILSYKYCIETAPLQIYVSALLFSPKHSLVRQLYQAEAPTWVTVTTDVEANWNACLQTLEGHSNSVCSVAFSPNGCQLASASHDETIKLWDVATGQCQKTLEGHGNYATSVAFPPDGRQLASAYNDKTIKLYDVATGQCQQTLEGHGDSISSVVFSPDGRQLASASHDGTIKLWDIATGQCQQTLEGHGDGINSVVFSPDGQQLASASHDETIKIWDIATGQCQQTLEGHGGWVLSVAFSPDGRRLASAADKTIKLWNTATGQCQQTLEGHGGWVESVAFSPDGRQLASASHDHTVKTWDVATGQCQQTLEGHGDSISSVVFSPDGRQLASASNDGTIKLWDIATGLYQQTLEGHGDRVRSVAFSPDGRQLASASDDETIMLWDVATGLCQQTLEGHSWIVTSIAFSSDGRQLASASRDQTIKLWDTATGQCQKTLEGHGRGINSVAFSPNRRQLASASNDKTIKLWDIATGQCQQTLEGHGGWVESVAFSPDGRQLASACDDETVKLWDAATGRCQETLKGESSLDHVFETAIQKPTHEFKDWRGILLKEDIWVSNGPQNILWLPSEYRAESHEAKGSTLAIGCRSGRVLILQFI
nr:uncharacterized protein CTRU02_03646 [Colletotrichum truncatum]KAF6796668.1 hypothetical protein CTRU02_03646 [Colletotrichum truncatum]